MSHCFQVGPHPELGGGGGLVGFGEPRLTENLENRKKDPQFPTFYSEWFMFVNTPNSFTFEALF